MEEAAPHASLCTRQQTLQVAWDAVQQALARALMMCMAPYPALLLNRLQSCAAPLFQRSSMPHQCRLRQHLAALQVLDSLLAQEGEDAEVWSQAGRVQLLLGDVGAAAGCFSRVEAAAEAAAGAASAKGTAAELQVGVHSRMGRIWRASITLPLPHPPTPNKPANKQMHMLASTPAPTPPTSPPPSGPQPQEPRAAVAGAL
jgi:hypothetical protein